MNNQLAKLIEDLEVELLRPDVRKSAKRLGELLADEFFEFGASGNRYSKQDIIDILPKLEDAKYSATNFEAREIATNTVLLTYESENEEIQTNKKRYSLRASLWQNRNGKWQMIFHQGTPKSKKSTRSNNA